MMISLGAECKLTIGSKLNQIFCELSAKPFALFFSSA